jgi:hypothetical protein
LLAKTGTTRRSKAYHPVRHTRSLTAVASTATPPGFPADIAITRERFENWSGEIVIDDVWVAIPASLEQLVAVVNWAAASRPATPWHVRAVGSRHSWAPFVIGEQDKQRSVLVDLRPAFSDLEMAGPNAVRAGAGVKLGDLLDFLDRNGKGLSSFPSLGEVTVGGLLAIGAHGTGVRVADGDGGGEAPSPPRAGASTWGSFSNRVLEMTVIAWDPSTSSYVARVVSRDDSDCAALLVALGRTIITEVVLQVDNDVNLRCQSITNIPGDELFGPPEDSAHRRSFSRFLERYGRVETTWFPFTDAPWLKVWEVSARRPRSSREVTAPFNYAFQDMDVVNRMIAAPLIRAPKLAPMFGILSHAGVVAGLSYTKTWDIWGASKNVLQYVTPNTLRVTAGSYAIVTSRGNVQSVVHRVTGQWRSLIETYRQQGKFPINSPIHIRVTGLDHVGGLMVTVVGQKNKTTTTTQQQQQQEKAGLGFRV